MRSRVWVLALALGVGAAGTSVSLAKDTQPLERFTAFAVDMGGGAGRNTGTVDIVIERWSTDAEWKSALDALSEAGSDGLLKELQDVEPRVGYIRTANSLGYSLRLAHQTVLPTGSRRILIATDRPLSFLETYRNSRTRDYPFLVVEIRLGPDGEGDGKLMPVARVTKYPDDVVEIEDYATQPVRLTKVRTAG